MKHPADRSMRELTRRQLAYSWSLASNGAVDLKGQSFRGAPVLDLTNNNGITRAAGPSAELPDAAALASASTQFFSRAFDPALDPNPAVAAGIAQPFAISSWAYPAADGAFYGLANSRSAGNKWTLQRPNTNIFSMNVWDGGGTIRTANHALTTTAATWYFVVAGWDGARVFVEVNSAGRVFADCVGVNLAQNTLIIGGNTAVPANPWNGRLAQFNMWVGRIPTRKEINWLYNGGQGRNISGKP